MNTPVMTEEDKRIEEFAWQTFARFHPHEAYAAWPERFWNYFHVERPEITREQMERLLKETE